MMLLMVEAVVMSLMMVAVSLMFVVSMMESLMFTTTRIAPAPADFVSRVILSPIIVPYTYLAMLFAMLPCCHVAMLPCGHVICIGVDKIQLDEPKLFGLPTNPL